MAEPGGRGALWRGARLQVAHERRRAARTGRRQGRAVYLVCALGGRLTVDELMRLPGSDEVYSALARQAMLLLDGDTSAAEEVVQDSFVALQHASSGLADLEKARICLRRAVVNRSRSVRRHRAVNRNAPEPAPDAPAAGQGVTGHLHREAEVFALRALPDRQREAIVLCNYLGLSEAQAAEAMGIGAGAVRSHLARGTSSLGPQ